MLNDGCVRSNLEYILTQCLPKTNIDQVMVALWRLLCIKAENPKQMHHFFLTAFPLLFLITLKDFFFGYKIAIMWKIYCVLLVQA